MPRRILIPYSAVSRHPLANWSNAMASPIVALPTFCAAKEAPTAMSGRVCVTSQLRDPCTER
eukprot:11577432-Alexandrium_andersonii.AAC.1